MDTLTVAGMGHRLNGDYDCDIAGLVDISSDQALLVSEANFVKEFSGARGGEIVEGFLSGDIAVRSALAIVILRRAGKRIDTDMVLNAKAGWARFELVAREDEDEEDPPVEDEETETSPSMSGGQSSDTPSVNPADDLPRIGALG